MSQKFTIPRKQKNVQAELLRAVTQTSREYREVRSVLRQSIGSLALTEVPGLDRVEIVENTPQQDAYQERRKEMRSLGYSANELSEHFCYLPVGSFEAAVKLCSKGLSAGSQTKYCLGDPELGVYLYKNVRAARQSYLFMPPGTPSKCLLVLFRVTRGRVKSVSPGQLEPTPNYDCHVARPGGAPSEQSLYYIFEFGEEDMVSTPRHCCPYAVVHWSDDPASLWPSTQSRRSQFPSCEKDLSCGLETVMWSGCFISDNGTTRRRLFNGSLCAFHGAEPLCSKEVLGTKIILSRRSTLAKVLSILPPHVWENTTGCAQHLGGCSCQWLLIRPDSDAYNATNLYCHLERKKHVAVCHLGGNSRSFIMPGQSACLSGKLVALLVIRNDNEQSEDFNGLTMDAALFSAPQPWQLADFYVQNQDVQHGDQLGGGHCYEMGDFVPHCADVWYNAYQDGLQGRWMGSTGGVGPILHARAQMEVSQPYDYMTNGVTYADQNGYAMNGGVYADQQITGALCCGNGMEFSGGLQNGYGWAFKEGMQDDIQTNPVLHQLSLESCKVQQMHTQRGERATSKEESASEAQAAISPHQDSLPQLKADEETVASDCMSLETERAWLDEECDEIMSMDQEHCTTEQVLSSTNRATNSQLADVEFEYPHKERSGLYASTVNEAASMKRMLTEKKPGGEGAVTLLHVTAAVSAQDAGTESVQHTPEGHSLLIKKTGECENDAVLMHSAMNGSCVATVKEMQETSFGEDVLTEESTEHEGSTCTVLMQARAVHGVLNISKDSVVKEPEVLTVDSSEDEHHAVSLQVVDADNEHCADNTGTESTAHTPGHSLATEESNECDADTLPQAMSFLEENNPLLSDTLSSFSLPLSPKHTKWSTSNECAERGYPRNNVLCTLGMMSALARQFSMLQEFEASDFCAMMTQDREFVLEQLAQALTRCSAASSLSAVDIIGFLIDACLIICKKSKSLNRHAHYTDNSLLLQTDSPVVLTAEVNLTEESNELLASQPRLPQTSEDEEAQECDMPYTSHQVPPVHVAARFVKENDELHSKYTEELPEQQRSAISRSVSQLAMEACASAEKECSAVEGEEEYGSNMQSVLAGCPNRLQLKSVAPDSNQDKKPDRFGQRGSANFSSRDVNCEQVDIEIGRKRKVHRDIHTTRLRRVEARIRSWQCSPSTERFSTPAKQRSNRCLYASANSSDHCKQEDRAKDRHWRSSSCGNGKKRLVNNSAHGSDSAYCRSQRTRSHDFRSPQRYEKHGGHSHQERKKAFSSCSEKLSERCQTSKKAMQSFKHSTHSLSDRWKESPRSHSAHVSSGSVSKLPWSSLMSGKSSRRLSENMRSSFRPPSKQPSKLSQLPLSSAPSLREKLLKHSPHSDSSKDQLKKSQRFAQTSVYSSGEWFDEHMPNDCVQQAHHSRGQSERALQHTLRPVHSCEIRQEKKPLRLEASTKKCKQEQLELSSNRHHISDGQILEGEKQFSRTNNSRGEVSKQNEESPSPPSRDEQLLFLQPKFASFSPQHHHSQAYRSVGSLAAENTFSNEDNASANSLCFLSRVPEKQLLQNGGDVCSPTRSSSNGFNNPSDAGAEQELCMSMYSSHQTKSRATTYSFSQQAINSSAHGCSSQEGCMKLGKWHQPKYFSTSYPSVNPYKMENSQARHELKNVRSGLCSKVTDVRRSSSILQREKSSQTSLVKMSWSMPRTRLLQQPPEIFLHENEEADD